MHEEQQPAVSTPSVMSDAEKADEKVVMDAEPKKPFAMPTFPEGGTRAWLVVFGAMIVNGCSFGYLSSFG